MRKSRFFICLGIAAVTLSVFMFSPSCKKKEKGTTASADDSAIATDHALSEQAFDDAQSIADAANGTSSGGTIYRTTGLTAGGCATVTHAAGTITVNFGTTNCLCSDYRLRRGKIIITYTGAYADSGSTHTITFDNFYQNNNHIEGTKTVTNMGHNSSGQPFFNIAVNGTVTRTTGASVHTVSNRVRTWTAGDTTPLNWLDDEYSITGTGTMTRTSAAGVVTNATVAVTAPLIIALNCRWIKAGTIAYTVSSATRTLNYGATPVCDSLATLTTASGTTVTIGLP